MKSKKKLEKCVLIKDLRKIVELNEQEDLLLKIKE